jgi:cation diffusion facilitator family transporter
MIMNRAARNARLSILSNTVLILMKFAVGLVSGSVSIISEAIHSLMDLAAAVMAFFSIRIAGRPADEDHPYGHQKVENVSGALEALLIIVAAGLIIYESVKRLIGGAEIENLWLGALVMLVSGIVNIIVSRRLYKVAREESSVALAADALHLRTDVYSSLGVGAGLLAIVVLQSAFSVPWAESLDPIVALCIALFIVKEAWDMVRHAVGPLLDASLPPEDLAVVEAVVAARPGVSMHGVRTRMSGKVRYIDFHLEVPEDLSVKESHEICDEIEREIERALRDASVLIHIEPKMAVRVRGKGARRLSLTKDELLARIAGICAEAGGYDARPHHLHVFGTGLTKELTFHVTAAPGMSLEEAHSLASVVEARVKESLGLEATVHIEPAGDDPD